MTVDQAALISGSPFWTVGMETKRELFSMNGAMIQLKSRIDCRLFCLLEFFVQFIRPPC
jgi:hypothetical protein